MHFAGPLILQIEAGDPVVMLAGAHVGCFELFGTDQIHAIRDLKGTTVAIPEVGAPGHVLSGQHLGPRRPGSGSGLQSKWTGLLRPA